MTQREKRASLDPPIHRPGHPEAVAAGCACPRIDNGRGNVELARDRGGWWIVSDCPLHGEGGSHPALIPPQPGSRPIAVESRTNGAPNA